MKPSAPALLLCLLLTACASEPMHYYHLAAADTPAPSSASTPLRTTPSTERLPLVIEVRLPDGRWDRMFLHARYLRLPHPVSGEELTFEAPLPDACQALLGALAPLNPSAKAAVSRS